MSVAAVDHDRDGHAARRYVALSEAERETRDEAFERERADPTGHWNGYLPTLVPSELRAERAEFLRAVYRKQERRLRWRKQ